MESSEIRDWWSRVRERFEAPVEIVGPKDLGQFDQVVNARTGEIFEVTAVSGDAWSLFRSGAEERVTLCRLPDGTTFAVPVRQP